MSPETAAAIARSTAPEHVFTEKTFYLEEFYGKSLLFALVPPVGDSAPAISIRW